MSSGRVLRVDELPEMRVRVPGLLRDEFDIVGSAQNGHQATEEAAALDPDLI